MKGVIFVFVLILVQAFPATQHSVEPGSNVAAVKGVKGYTPFSNPGSKSYQQWMQALFSTGTQHTNVQGKTTPVSSFDALFSHVVPRDNKEAGTELQPNKQQEEKKVVIAGTASSHSNTTNAPRSGQVPDQGVTNGPSGDPSSKKGGGGKAAKGGKAAASPSSSSTSTEEEGLSTADIVRRPNVLMILVDQWRFSALGSTPFKVRDYGVQTPFLDFLASQSLVFSSAYAANPLCTPARASILTSLHSHQHGLTTTNLRLPRSRVPTLAEVFKAQGYQTYYQGKWHLDGAGSPGYVPPGWRRHSFDHFDYAFNRGHRYFDSKSFFSNGTIVPSTDEFEPSIQSRQAVRTMEAHVASHPRSPFLLVTSFGPPHDPYTPPRRFMKAGRTVRFRANVPEGDRTHAARTRTQAYLGLCEALDLEASRLWRGLQRLRLLDSTVVVFTADHGDLLHSHGDAGRGAQKNSFFEESLRVPLLLRLPRPLAALTGLRPHRVARLPVSQVDILPTLLGLLAVPTPPHCSGEDVLPLVKALDDLQSTISTHRSPQQGGRRSLRLHKHSLSHAESVLIERAKARAVVSEGSLTALTPLLTAGEESRGSCTVASFDLRHCGEWRAVVTARHKLVLLRRYDTSQQRYRWREHFLFDLLADPFEQTNLLATTPFLRGDNAAHERLLDGLRRAFTEHARRTDDPFPHRTPQFHMAYSVGARLQLPPHVVDAEVERLTVGSPVATTNGLPGYPSCHRRRTGAGGEEGGAVRCVPNVYVSEAPHCGNGYDRVTELLAQHPNLVLPGRYEVDWWRSAFHPFDPEDHTHRARQHIDAYTEHYGSFAEAVEHRLETQGHLDDSQDRTTAAAPPEFTPLLSFDSSPLTFFTLDATSDVLPHHVLPRIVPDARHIVVTCDPHLRLWDEFLGSGKRREERQGGGTTRAFFQQLERSLTAIDECTAENSRLWCLHYFAARCRRDAPEQFRERWDRCPPLSLWYDAVADQASLWASTLKSERILVLDEVDLLPSSIHSSWIKIQEFLGIPHMYSIDFTRVQYPMKHSEDNPFSSGQHLTRPLITKRLLDFLNVTSRPGETHFSTTADDDADDTRN